MQERLDRAVFVVNEQSELVGRDRDRSELQSQVEGDREGLLPHVDEQRRDLERPDGALDGDLAAAGHDHGGSADGV